MQFLYKLYENWYSLYQSIWSGVWFLETCCQCVKAHEDLTDYTSKTFYTETAVSEMMKSFNLSDFAASICFQWPFITLYYTDGALNVNGLSRSSCPETITTIISLNGLKIYFKHEQHWYNLYAIKIIRFFFHRVIGNAVSWWYSYYVYIGIMRKDNE